MELSNITYQGPEITDMETFNMLPVNLRQLLSSLNGFIQYGGGLHVRGATSELKWHSIHEVWFGPLALSKIYNEVLETDIPFAQDCVADQYLLRENEVWLLSAETGEIENLGLNLKAFFGAIAENPVEFLAMEPLLELQQEGTVLEPGQLIHVYPPFCTKESENGVSLRPVSVVELVAYHAEFSAQLPSNGEQFTVKLDV